MTEDAFRRFMDKVGAHDPSGCWPWLGCTLRDGYGMVTIARKGLRVHRVTYEHFIGPIPPGLHIDHLCRNRRCVNPTHMEVVTSTENTRRGRQTSWSQHRAATHCPRQHAYTPENTYVSTDRAGRTHRHCRRCKLERKLEALRPDRRQGKGRGALIAHNGRTQSLSAWAREYGVRNKRLSERLARGWDMERALTTPARHASSPVLKTTWISRAVSPAP